MSFWRAEIHALTFDIFGSVVDGRAGDQPAMEPWTECEFDLGAADLPGLPRQLEAY